MEPIDIFYKYGGWTAIAFNFAVIIKQKIKEDKELADKLVKLYETY